MIRKACMATIIIALAATASAAAAKNQRAARLDANGNPDALIVRHAAGLFDTGAYRAADGNGNRAVHYYAAGYYDAAKSKRGSQQSGADAVNAFASTAELPPQ